MEHHDLLNPVDTVHLFALHYIFLPRINRALDSFMDAWNNHGVHGKTPNQIFTEGVLQLRNWLLTSLIRIYMLMVQLLTMLYRNPHKASPSQPLI